MDMSRHFENVRDVTLCWLNFAIAFAITSLHGLLMNFHATKICLITAPGVSSSNDEAIDGQASSKTEVNLYLE
jgi:hypothetical protein